MRLLRLLRPLRLRLRLRLLLVLVLVLLALLGLLESLDLASKFDLILQGLLRLLLAVLQLPTSTR